MVFGYPGEPHPPVLLPVLWNIGLLLALVGGYWFFFLLRVNVVHDGQPPWRLVRADLFIVTLLGSLTFALLFEWAAMAGSSATATKVFAGLYLLFTTLLCVSVPWSKLGDSRGRVAPSCSVGMLHSQIHISGKLPQLPRQHLDLNAQPCGQATNLIRTGRAYL